METIKTEDLTYLDLRQEAQDHTDAEAVMFLHSGGQRGEAVFFPEYNWFGFCTGSVAYWFRAKSMADGLKELGVR